MSYMTGIWSFGKFALAEAQAMFYGLSYYIGNAGSLEE